MTKPYSLQVTLLRLPATFLILILTGFFTITNAQVTTSSMEGRVVDENGEALIGANVLAVHTPSGTSYGTATDIDGSYRFPGMRVGGPYRVTVSYTGFAELTLENVMLRLGEAQRHDFTMQTSATELEAIMVVAQSGVAGQNAGTSTQITTEEIDLLPTLSRNINDFLRLTPQGSIYNSDGITFAGTNNRYNAIYIDGAVNNDVYGLAASGSNGGQTGISPFSIDIIDQFQVSISPYDVSLGGFAGAGINAVTKSGTNTVSGTAYAFHKNESLAGKTNGLLAERLGLDDSQRTKLAEFSQTTYGASLGGPIVKDKVFFFANVELQDDETPTPFDYATYGIEGRYTEAQLDALRAFVTDEYGYDPGEFRSSTDELDGLKLFGKLDFNLSEKHRLTLRHQYTKAEQIDISANSSTQIYFQNTGLYFPSTTNSSALELNSRFGNKFSNNLILGFTRVLDDRDASGGDFPYVIIEDAASGSVRFGSDEFSTANQLDQKIFTITDNFKIYSGDHSFTIGTHNEFYSMYNLFIGQNFGTYTYSSLQDFIDDAGARLYTRSYSLVDDITGDGSAAAADFNAMQLGFYVQDEWSVNNKFTLTGGLRLDIPVITSDPEVDPSLNSVTLPALREAYPIANDVEGGKAPDGQLMFSPRLGFQYDVTGNQSLIIRGGLGIFTSRIPFVWPGAMFSNNGLIVGRVTEAQIDSIVFIPDVNEQYVNPNPTIPSGQVDLFVKDFKYPQVFRTNLALDKSFGSGWKFSLEGIYSKKLNDVEYYSINSDPEVKFNFTNNGGDTRAIYYNRNIVSTYSAVYLADNTDQGYSYSVTGALSRDFNFGLNAYVAYSYGDTYSVNDGTSSQNSSQWRGQVHINGRNNPVYGRSDYAMGHRVVGSLSYRLKWTEDGGFGTSIGLFYNGQSGSAFSYVIGGGSAAQNLNGERGSTSNNRSLVYIPIDENDINLVEYTVSGNPGIPVAEQWANLNALIEDDESLSENRGKYAEKNGATAPFLNQWDLAIRQDLGAKLGNNLNRIQLSLDITNFANLLNSDWGAIYSIPGNFNNYFLYQFERYDTDGTTPLFSYRGTKTGKDRFDISSSASRWRMRVGIRYIFN